MRQYVVFFLLSAIAAMGLVSCSTPKGGSRPGKSVTVYLIRHAEKGNGNNPDLTLEGQARAQKLAHFFEEIRLDDIYSTDTRRTLQTVEPLSQSQRLRVQKYEGDKLDQLTRRLLRGRKGRSYLVVGHADTTPKLAGLLTNSPPLPQIGDNDYDNLWMVIDAGTKRARLVKFNL